MLASPQMGKGMEGRELTASPRVLQHVGKGSAELNELGGLRSQGGVNLGISAKDSRLVAGQLQLLNIHVEYPTPYLIVSW